jgi:hypothetical protein
MKKLTLLVLFAVAAAGAWYWYSPPATVERLRAAARENDVEELNRVVDFETLRENLKVDVKARIAEAVRSEDTNPLLAFGLAAGGLMVDGVVDVLVSPSGLAALARGQANLSPAERTAESREEPPTWIDREDFNRFTVRFTEDPSVDHAPVLVFHRHGIHWKLTRVRLTKTRNHER